MPQQHIPKLLQDPNDRQVWQGSVDLLALVYALYRIDT